MLGSILKKADNIGSIDAVNFDDIFKKYCNKTLVEVTFADVVNLSDPYEKGQTNEVIRYLNGIRDEKAMKILEQSKKNHKSIFMTAGLDHVLTWEPIIDSMYKESIK